MYIYVTVYFLVELKLFWCKKKRNNDDDDNNNNNNNNNNGVSIKVLVWRHLKPNNQLL